MSVYLVGVDFEMANSKQGSLCAYGLAYPDGTVDTATLMLHPERGGDQERARWHHISPEQTAFGLPPTALYRRLERLPEDTVLVAHDARIDRSQLYGWFNMWELEPLHFAWFDTLRIARREYGKTAKTGIAAMAKRMKMQVKAHNAGDDARVALAIATRYDWGKFIPMTYETKAPARES